MANNYTKEAVRGVFWTYSSYYLGKLLVFISTVILARLLTKSDFGVVSFALLLIGFLDTINGAGISSALIYYQDDEKAAHTAFWIDLGLGIFVMAAAWVFAPIAGRYFDDPRIVDFIRAFSVVFPISSLEDLPKVLLTRNLSFNVQIIPDTLQALMKGLISIALALAGFGAWSLAIGHIIGALVSMIAYWMIIPWRPKFEFATKWVRSIVSYGGGIVATNLLSYILVNIDYLFVGYFLGAIALGVYTIAFKIPDLLIVQFCSLVGKVIFPVYAKMKQDADSLKKAFLKTMNYVAIITVPIGLGLMLIAKPFVLAIFTEKWIDAVPVMRAISLYALFLSLAYNASHAYKAQGAISVLTSVSIFRALILLPGLWWASAKVGSIEAVGWAHAVIAFIGGCINLVVAGRVMNTSIREIVASLRPSIIAGCFMSAVVWAMLAITSSYSPWFQLIISIASGILFYMIALSWLQKGIFVEAWKVFQSSMSSRAS
jgi:O-antigen/teichoic acid export membrane protein